MTLIKALSDMQILVADDNDANCLIARTILERAGHHVVTAEHGLHALNLAKANKFDLIILDILMPVMDGLAALENIRQKTLQNRETPIFALTAYCDIEDRKRYSAAGFDAVLAKPLRRGDLETAFHHYKSRGATSPVEPAKGDLSQNVPLLDAETISMLTAFGDPDRLREIQFRFWASVQFKCGTIKAVLPDAIEGDGPQLSEFRRAVHAIKGASASIGLARVTHICRDLRNAPPEKIPALMTGFIQALRDSRSVLDQALTRPRKLDTAI
jgi:CheY-like chemotaxis protein